MKGRLAGAMCALLATMAIAGPAFANEVLIGPQAMEGDLKVNPGDTVRAGISFTIPGSHPATTVQFVNAAITFDNVECQSGPSGRAFGHQLGSNGLVGPIQVPANDSSWFPTGDQSSAASYQMSTVAPDLCNGGTMSLRNGGVFSGDLQSDQTNSINVRFHYSANGSSGSWSATKSFAPDPITTNQVPSGSVGILLAAILLAAVFFAGSRRVRAPAGV
jgi:hypothetical protein